MKRGISCFLLVVMLGAVQAHEFWLLPTQFKYKVGDLLQVDFKVGESFEGDYWNLEKNSVDKIELHNRIGSVDLSTKVKNTRGQNVEYTFNNVGTHLISMQSGESYIESTPQEFEVYLEEDGLQYIQEEREKLGEQNKVSREVYSRYAKLLVQAGDRTDDTFQKIAGLKYEVVPLQNPYDLKSGDYMDCKILFRGNPEPHALVKVWNHIGNRTFLQNIYTESDGTIRFPISNNGSWMVSSVKMIRSNSNKAEWESMWGSLVFGIQ